MSHHFTSKKTIDMKSMLWLECHRLYTHSGSYSYIVQKSYQIAKFLGFLWGRDEWKKGKQSNLNLTHNVSSSSKFLLLVFYVLHMSPLLSLFSFFFFYSNISYKDVGFVSPFSFCYPLEKFLPEKGGHCFVMFMEIYCNRLL